MKRTIRLKESELKRMISESVKRVLRESRLPQYNEPVFINCSSLDDADMAVELGYCDYDSSLFYVGECGTDAYAALEAVVEYLEDNGIVDSYTVDEEFASEYPDDCVEVNGHYFEACEMSIRQLVDNHGGRRKF